MLTLCRPYADPMLALSTYPIDATVLVHTSDASVLPPQQLATIPNPDLGKQERQRLKGYYHTGTSPNPDLDRQTCQMKCDPL